MENGSIESLYPTVMGSLIYRLSAADECLRQIEEVRDDQENWVRIDTVALQVRKACELFLLSSTLAHFEDGNGIDLGHWHPKDAFREISKVNDNPLPLPLEPQMRVVDGANQIVPYSKPIPFNVLASIYGQCGNIIHVPPASKVLEEKIPSFDFDKFRGWVQGFVQILRGHVLLLPQIRKMLVFQWSGDSNAAPHAFLLEGEGEAIFVMEGLRDFDLLTP